jgi:hypothetical protein
MAAWCSKHSQYAHDCTECKADEFFDGFEPKTIKIDPIGPTAALLVAAKRDRETANMHGDSLKALQAQLQAVTQERDQAQDAQDKWKDAYKSEAGLVAQLQARNQELEKALRAIVNERNVWSFSYQAAITALDHKPQEKP